MVAWTRYQLVHPKAGKMQVYQYPGLLVEAWLLLRHYLVLLILHSLDYQGLHRELRMLQGTASTTAPVPWAAPKITPVVSLDQQQEEGRAVVCGGPPNMC